MPLANSRTAQAASGRLQATPRNPDAFQAHQEFGKGYRRSNPSQKARVSSRRSWKQSTHMGRWSSSRPSTRPQPMTGRSAGWPQRQQTSTCSGRDGRMAKDLGGPPRQTRYGRAWGAPGDGEQSVPVLGCKSGAAWVPRKRHGPGSTYGALPGPWLPGTRTTASTPVASSPGGCRCRRPVGGRSPGSGRARPVQAVAEGDVDLGGGARQHATQLGGRPRLPRPARRSAAGPGARNRCADPDAMLKSQKFPGGPA
jgi:hypothetical protein